MPSQKPPPSDRISRIKGRLRQSRLLSVFMGCPYPAPRWEKAVNRIIRLVGHDAKILDLGSGMDRRAPNVINLEIEATPNVDILADGHSLPFKNQVFDAVITEAVLEHVREPKQVAGEIYRTLKDGGYVCAGVPFLQAFHASPHDYQRYTVPGFDYLFRAFTKIEGGDLRRSNRITALDFSRICRSCLFVWESVNSETDFADCGLVDVPSGVAGLPIDAQQTFRIFWRRRCILSDKNRFLPQTNRAKHWEIPRSNRISYNMLRRYRPSSDRSARKSAIIGALQP